MTGTREFRRGRPAARWSEPELAEVVLGVLAGAPDVLWSADDVRERLAFGREGAGRRRRRCAARCARWRRAGRVERVEVWGRRGWGNTGPRLPARPAVRDGGGPPGLTVAA